MIYVFTGSDRVKISAAIKKVLGADYEVFEGENLTAADLANIFLGQTIFSDKRHVLIKDLTFSSIDDPYTTIAPYVDTSHIIAIWETSPSRKKSCKDFLKNKTVQNKRYDLAVSIDSKKIFDVFDIAMRDGCRAVKMVEEMESSNDPYMFFGLLASQALRKFQFSGGAKERSILKSLSDLDLAMKSSTVNPWMLIKSFLLQLSTL